MYFHHNGNVAWISLAKNACMSWIQVFDELGWTKDNLYEPQVDVSKLKFFGFLRDPDQRHTMGVVEYLQRHQLLGLLYHDEFCHVLAAGVFDQHSYAISHVVPEHIIKTTTFFIIDQTYYDYELLVQNFLEEHGVTISTPVPRVNSGQSEIHQHRQRLQEIKQSRTDIHSSLMKNFLEPDRILYLQHIKQQNLWARPGRGRRQF
jgi:hypothetical protein